MDTERGPSHLNRRDYDRGLECSCDEPQLDEQSLWSKLGRTTQCNACGLVRRRESLVSE